MGDLGKKVEHEILIKPTHNNGFIVTIGCTQFSYEGPNNMLRDLRRYIDDPEGKERELNAALRYKEPQEPNTMGPTSIAQLREPQEPNEPDEN